PEVPRSGLEGGLRTSRDPWSPLIEGDTSGCGSGLSKPSDRSARVLSDEVDAGSAKESASKQRPRDAGLMQSGRLRL
ncbi:hypothetical protein C1631_023685, partial [Chryseobacterium phosphatilyticum]